MTKPDGGPAFPAYEHFFAAREDSNGPVTVITGEPHGGMSLRDWFASRLLSGVFANDTDIDDDILARRCYEVADAMLKARENV